MEMDDEILQDFLIEASEIVELLGEQLVDLEHSPDDSDLLNAIFRGFHTVKGGAGFLGVTPLVETCHRAEDVFGLLRQGQRHVDAGLMDVVLEALDVVNESMESLRQGEEPESADPDLLKRLEVYAVPEGEEAAENKDQPVSEPKPEPDPEPEEPVAEQPEIVAGGADITEDEFDALLDQLHGKGKHGDPKQDTPGTDQPASGDMTEDEFDALLDQLHGTGKHGGIKSDPVAPVAPEASQTTSEETTEQEFDALLDQLHGKGKHGDSQAPEPASNKTPKKDVKKEPAKPKPVAAKAAPASEEQAKAPTPAQPKAKPAKTETTVRVDTGRLDDIMNMVGELVLVRNRLQTLRAVMDDEEVNNAVGNLDIVTADLQLAVMKTRMQPVKKVFGRFPRVVRDLARTLNKEIDLVMHGEETDLDKNLVEALADPLVHLVRNSVDHGIEIPDVREKAGKPRKGLVTLTANQEGDHILLTIEDDGKGMDADVLRGIAVEKGMMDAEAAARLDDRDCFNLIFAPGFSTKKEITDVSGRGVGMDVVKTRIAQMNGTVEIDSKLGKGSLITIKLPLTLAILPTLMVELGNQPFALPLASVVEIFSLDLSKTNTVDNQLTIRVRDRALPLFYLRLWLAGQSTERDYSKGGGHVIVVNVSGRQMGLVVDQLVGQEEVVIKPLGALLQKVKGMAGATITGDGNIALILDLPSLIRKYVENY